MSIDLQETARRLLSSRRRPAGDGSTTFSERARSRMDAYIRHHKPGPAMRQTVVPEDLRDLPEFVELETERQAIESARSRAREEQEAWRAQWQADQQCDRSAELRSAELALEAGTSLSRDVGAFLPPPDRKYAQWPFAQLASLSEHWMHCHRALEAEERARVIGHGQEPLG